MAEALRGKNAVILLDGIEPLQYGPGSRSGELRDLGLRAFLRRLTALAPSQATGLVVATSRLPLKDLYRWRGGAHQEWLLEELPPAAGAALLRDLGVRGNEDQLREASVDFGGHALSLSLLASLITELHGGDIRQRSWAGELLHRAVPGRDHAQRVLKSLDDEWLKSETLLRSIMLLTGLFSGPASLDALKALVRQPAMKGLTEDLPRVGGSDWKHAVARLCEVRLLIPRESRGVGVLEAHPIVQEWFGSALQNEHPAVWQAAHGRLYDHFRRAVHEGDKPTLEQLAPLYAAVGHGCQAQRHFEAMKNVYWERIQRRTPMGRLMGYSWKSLGAAALDLSLLCWFFDPPFERVNANIPWPHHPWLFNAAALLLRSQGDFRQSIELQTRALAGDERNGHSLNIGIDASNLAETHTALGELGLALESARRSARLTGSSGDAGYIRLHDGMLGRVLALLGRDVEAKQILRQVRGGSFATVHPVPARICHRRLLSWWGRLESGLPEKQGDGAHGRGQGVCPRHRSDEADSIEDCPSSSGRRLRGASAVQRSRRHQGAVGFGCR